MKKFLYSTIAALALLACSNDDSVTPVEREEEPVYEKNTCDYLKDYVVSTVYLKNDTGYVYNQGMQNLSCLETTSDSIFAVNFSEGIGTDSIIEAYRFYKFSIEDVESERDSLPGTLYQTVFGQDTTQKDQEVLLVSFDK